MKNSIKSFVFLAFLLASFFNSHTEAANMNLSPTPDQLTAYVILPAGTVVFLELNQEVSSEEVEVGHALELTVRNDVKVNGKVLIRAGSAAEGRVTKVDKFLDACTACDNACSKITISVESVMTVDGQSALLNSTPLTKRGGCAGVGPAILEIGTRISARVRNDVTVMY